jgi:glutathione S-transferase
MAIELFHDWNSVCSYKVRACLAEKELPWDSRRIDLMKFENLSEDYLTLNPNGVVPTLRHDGIVVIESSVINEYLDECFPSNPLVPRDPAARAAMRIWVKYQDDVVFPAQRPATFRLMVGRMLRALTHDQIAALVARHPQPERAQYFLSWASGPSDMKIVEEARQKLRQVIIRLNGRLVSSPWLAGESFSLAEVAFAPFVERLERLGFADLWRDQPAVGDWMERIKSRPSYAAARSPRQFAMPGPEAPLAG